MHYNAVPISFYEALHQFMWVRGTQAVRIQVRATEMEVDRGFEALSVPVSARPGFVLLDHGIEAFRLCRGGTRDDR